MCPSTPIPVGIRQALAALLLLVSPYSQALEFGVSLGYLLEHSDNSLRSPDNELSDRVHAPSLDLSAEHSGPKLLLSGDYNLTRRQYQRDTYDDENLVTGHAALEWYLLPGRLEFVAENIRAQTLIQSSAPDTPSNRQVLALTSAGPNLYLRGFRSPDSIQFEQRFVEIRARVTDTDSLRRISTATYEMPLSQVTQLALEGNYTSVDFRNSLVADYSRWHALGRWRRQGALVDMNLGLGRAEVQREGRADLGRTIGDFLLVYHPVSTSSLSLLVQRDQQDHALELMRDIGVAGAPLPGEPQNADSDLNEIFTYTSVSLGWEHSFGRNLLRTELFADRQDYEDVPRDQNRRGGGIIIDRQLRPRLHADTIFRRIRISQPDLDRVDWENRLELGLRWQPWRRLHLGVRAGYETRSSDEATFEFSEYFGQLSLQYRLIGTTE